MRSSTIEETATGAALAFIGFMLIFSALPAPVAAQASQPLFSITVVAPTSNPLRRQWAAIIVQNYQSVNINAKLIYVSFGTMAALSFACSASNCAKLYADGGFDEIFVGFGGGTPLPDFGTQNVVTYRSATAADLAPIGNNFNFYKNSTFNALALQYNNDFNTTDRALIAQKMVRIAAQDRPDLVIFQPVDVYGYANNVVTWAQESSATNTNDYQHWKMTGGATTVNVAETGDFQSLDQLDIPASNIYYATYLYHPVSATLEELDARTLNYIPALATSITSSADHLTWTVSFQAHTFHDGVPVTADDYIFGTMAQLRNDVGSVSEGTLQSLLGLNVQFTFLNGTSDYVTNGTYTHGTAPAGFSANSVWTSLSATSFKFTVPSAYLFTDPILTGGSAVPMHIFEQFKASTWSSIFLSTLQSTPTTVTWNKARYGGNGSFAYAYGPIGDGAYVYKGYNSVAATGTLVKFANYWNASGLQSLGLFNIQTIHVVHIINKDQALGAFNTGSINFLDANYQLNPTDFAALQANGGTFSQRSSPSAGWQETTLNMVSPIWGTGTATPLGQKTPSQAAFAARQVRNAMSDLIPRQYIITNLLQGIGSIGITQFCTCYAFAYPSDVKADPYSVTAAKGLLAAAGYSTGVNPGSGTAGGITLPTATINIPGSTVTVPTFLLGNSFTLQGTFPVDAVLGNAHNGFAVILQQSTDSQKTWQNLFFVQSSSGGAFAITYTPTVTGTVSYRPFFTGLGWDQVQFVGFTNADLLASVVPPVAVQRPLNVTSVAFGAVSTLTIGTLGDIVKQLASGAQVTALGAQLQSALNNLTRSTQASLNTLSGSSASKTDLQGVQTTLAGQITTLNSSVSSLSTVAYAALAVAIVLGLIAIALSMRKPKA